MSTEAPPEGHRFTPTALFICGGLLIWASDFLAVYVIAAIACAKGWAKMTVAGMPIVAFIGTILTIAACAGSFVMLRVGVRRLQANGQLDESMRFIYFLAAAIGMLALVAILFNALPAWWLATECAPSAPS
jgi:hypothetical protein